MFKCPYCDKEFENKKALAGHISHCNKDSARVKPELLEYNKERNDLFCQYCGKQYKTQNSLHQHELRCKFNSSKIGPAKSGFKIAYERGWDPSWNRGLTKETDERVRLNSEHISESLRSNGNPFTGKHHTKESKEKIRIGTINYLNTLGDGIKVRYNKSACQFINDLNETLG